MSELVWIFCATVKRLRWLGCWQHMPEVAGSRSPCGHKHSDEAFHKIPQHSATMVRYHGNTIGWECSESDSEGLTGQFEGANASTWVTQDVHTPFRRGCLSVRSSQEERNVVAKCLLFFMSIIESFHQTSNKATIQVMTLGGAGQNHTVLRSPNTNFTCHLWSFFLLKHVFIVFKHSRGQLLAGRQLPVNLLCNFYSFEVLLS